MAKIKGAIVVDTERCKGCNLCVVACPLNVIAPTRYWKIPVTDVARVQRYVRTDVFRFIK